MAVVLCTLSVNKANFAADIALGIVFYCKNGDSLSYHTDECNVYILSVDVSTDGHSEERERNPTAHSHEATGYYVHCYYFFQYKNKSTITI